MTPEDIDVIAEAVLDGGDPSVARLVKEIRNIDYVSLVQASYAAKASLGRLAARNYPGAAALLKRTFAQS